MTTLNLQVAAADDDATEAQDDTQFSSVLTSNKAHAHPTLGDRFICGHRFTSVTIPKGANILTATIQLQPAGENVDDANIDIHAEDADNAVDFAADADVWNRARTSASVAWVEDSLGDSTYVTSPEIKTVIQEVVDRGSWASGNALVILLKGKSDLDKSLRPEGFGASLPVKLDIEFAVNAQRSYSRSIL